MKILIIEEESSSRTMLQDFLTLYGTCHAASTGAEALIAVDGMLDRKDPYRLICLDITMPEQDGQAILKKIRELERQRGLNGKQAAKIVVTTTTEDPKEITKAVVRGPGDSYLSKPLDLVQMRELLSDFGFRPLAPGETTPA